MKQKIQAMCDEFKAWRHELHAHPETAFEEVKTSDFIAAKLEEFGLSVHRGLAKTGVVGTLTKGDADSGKVIGLRADMDALFIQEENTFDHKSTIDGKMHACGHDGHSTMLLGAAKYLAEHGNFNGTVHFIFQPAEETGNEDSGGSTMVSEGLFEKFPVKSVYGMHNFPGLPLGNFSVKSGPMLASIDTIEFKIISEHNHPATQYLSPDPILIAAKVVEAFHEFKARYVNPAEPVILCISQFQSGEPYTDKPGVHVTPAEAYVRGSVYTLNDDIRDELEAGLRKITLEYAKTYDAACSFNYDRGYPVVVNTKAETEFAANVARLVVGEDRVEDNMLPVMGAEDFAFMLKERPGCYILIGNGDGEGTCYVHNPGYDFNDDIISTGVEYWSRLVEETFSQ